MNYTVLGMHCNACAYTIKNVLKTHGIDVVVDYTTHILRSNTDLNMQSINIILKNHNLAYRIQKEQFIIKKPSFIVQYYPVILLYMVSTTLVIIFRLDYKNHNPIEHYLHSFMAFVLICFALLKFVDIKGFATMFKQYDTLSKYIPIYAFAYPFIELALGVYYLLSDSYIVSVSIFTIFVMGSTLLGALHSIRNKKQYICACMGSFFTLPLSVVAIAENSSMILMAIVTIILRLL